MTDRSHWVCVGGPFDGERKNFLMKEREGVFILGIPGVSDPKILGWYLPSEETDEWIWKDEE